MMKLNVMRKVLVLQENRKCLKSLLKNLMPAIGLCQIVFDLFYRLLKENKSS